MISTHILDINLGLPAFDVLVTLEKQNSARWTMIKKEKTNLDGRINFDCPCEAGQYQLTFQIEDYFKRLNQESFFLTVPVAFQIRDIKRKYHIPLLLSPFGYNTYRGS